MGTRTKKWPGKKGAHPRRTPCHGLDIAGAEPEAAQLEKSSTKRKRKRRYKGPRPRTEKHVLAGCKDTRARIRAAWENATSHLEEKLRIKKKQKKPDARTSPLQYSAEPGDAKATQ